MSSLQLTAAAIVILATANLGAISAQPHPVATEPLEACDFGQRAPSAPAELDQYAFLIGNFEVRSIARKPDGTWSDTSAEAYWEGRWILGGTAIADYWYDQPPLGDSNPGRGVNVRMFRPESKQWTNMWQHSGLAEVRTLISEVRDNGLMYMWASHPDTSDSRRMRFEIQSPDKWVRVEQWSRDSGETWFDVSRLEATRTACPWRPQR